MKFLKSAALAAMLVGGVAQAAPVELLNNGSFEANLQSNGSWANYSKLIGWTGGVGGIELCNNVAGVASHGVNFVELDTYTNSSLEPVGCYRTEPVLHADLPVPGP